MADEPLNFEPSVPASGPVEVAEAADKAKAAFAAVNSVGKSPEAVEVPSELYSKGIQQRLAPLPNEKLAQENRKK